jgi:hypothetical protein
MHTLIAMLIGLAIPIVSISGQKLTAFKVTWENAPSFDDAPNLEDVRLDEDQTRFQTPKDGIGDPDYFKEGKVALKVRGESERERIFNIADDIALIIMRDKKYYRIDKVNMTRFGYYVHVDWGTKEESYSGHYLNMVIDIEEKMIWWCKCS